MVPTPDQVPSRRRANPARASRGPPPCPCCSAVIQTRGRARNRSSAGSPARTTSRLLSWGLKRARTALTGGNNTSCTRDWANLCGNGPAGLIAELAGSCTRDWANLCGNGPAGLIAELALASDVADYVRFRAVCRLWRRCTADPRAAGLDGRFLPGRWIMLDEASVGPRRRRFLNVSTGECIRMDLPELDEHRFLTLTPEGLILLLHRPTLVVRLLNPLTRQLTDLPPVTTLLKPGKKLESSFAAHDFGIVADASLVAGCFFDPRALAVAKPGDERWTVVCDSKIDSALPFAGRFYCATATGVMVLDTASSDQHRHRLRLVAERRISLFYFYPIQDSLHLVDNGAELLLVRRTPWQDPNGNWIRKYYAYKVDLDAGTLVPVKGLRGRAVFMGLTRSISIPTETFPFVNADTIYLGSDCYSRIIGYNLADGSSESLPDDLSFHDETFDCDREDYIEDSLDDLFLDGRMHPFTIVDCLSYSIKGSGKQLCLSSPIVEPEDSM